MLMRCAAKAMTGAAVMAGMAGLALGVGTLAAALVAKRLWEERSGWRGTGHGPGHGPAPLPADPAPEAPVA